MQPKHWISIALAILSIGGGFAFVKLDLHLHFFPTINKTSSPSGSTDDNLPGGMIRIPPGNQSGGGTSGTWSGYEPPPRPIAPPPPPPLKENFENYSEAKEFAEQGNAVAQHYLAVCYTRGTDDVSKDYSEAVKWYRKSADQGFVKAQFNLGICYENGFGVAKDIREAFKWYSAAEKGGHDRAREAIERCENQLPRAMTTLKLPKPVEVPPIPTGRHVKVSTVDQLLDAVVYDAQDGDVIVLAQGTYTLNETLKIDQSLALYGDPEKPQNVKITNSNYNNPAAIATTESGASITLIGLDISSKEGNGIDVANNSSADVSFCNIHDCNILRGGGISSPYHKQNIKIVVEHCVISDNHHGIDTDGELVVNNCLVRGNNGFGIAGASPIHASALADVTGCIITQNGRGVSMSGGNMTDCEITHNSDGVHISAGNVTNCEISQNRGDGIYAGIIIGSMKSGNIKVSDCTITDNSGSGVNANSVPSEFRNNILRNNQGGNWKITASLGGPYVTRIGNKPNE